MAAELRNPTGDDAPMLAAFGRQAFDTAFGHLYQPEDMAAFFAEARSEEVYRAAIADPLTHLRLAFVDGELAAYALMVLGKGLPERPPPQPARPAFLSQLYCGIGATGKGIGAALLEEAIARAREWGADALQLSVFSENFGAQRFYQRYGFRHVADIDYWVGNHRDDEFLYELPLAGG
ncbi:GNAT family N-acetyltransferase [Altererythrobacter sp. B11]|uniref:GNAT family N-acetyltransferase n=1 Tax=Altererythrobacter sp. B11 TaxID=2060312 RepID=UPI000E5A63E1|nr:GNAT family N-acetyltransferase [Altererythrobacter sp. B11]